MILYRLISFIVLFAFVSTTLYFHNGSRHEAAGEYSHMPNEIPSGTPAPSINGKVTRDPSGSWLLAIQTENFQFVPEKAGLKEASYHEGHAHLYIDGKKINRIYGKYYHLDKLKKGNHVIKVTLNSHNHGTLVQNGKEIAFKKKITVH